MACDAALVGAVPVAAAPGGRAAEVVDGLAIVQGDGSPRVDGRTVRLHGAYLPDADPACRSVVRSARCSSPAVGALRGKVTGFVRCGIVRGGGEVLEGICTVPGRDRFGPGEDLAAWLIERGRALATPDAPARYHTLERLARSREVGLWESRSRRHYRHHR